MQQNRAFISFEMEDEVFRDFLVQHARDNNNSLTFLDYSVHEPFDTKWKTECKKRIAQTKGTIVMIGTETFKSAAVLWEINETIKQDHNILGIKIFQDTICNIPRGLSSCHVVQWNLDLIMQRLNNWT